MKGLNLLLFLLILLSENTFGQQKEGIQFKENMTWSEIKTQAQSEKKIIFIDVYATWCKPCKMMDQQVYADEILGNYFNERFLSIKIQIDSSKNDNEHIKKMYGFAKKIKDDYGISVVPTYLFFDSRGKLLHQAQGFSSIKDFHDIAETAADPTKNFTYLLNSYNKGQLTGPSLLTLSLALRKMKKDSMAILVAQKYKSSYLDSKDPKNILTPEIIPIFENFTTIYHANDPLIKYIHKHQIEVDTTVKYKDFSKTVVDYLVSRDIVTPELKKVEIQYVSKSSWSEIKKKIAKSFDNEVAERNILSNKITWYTKNKDWDNVVKLHIEKIDKFGVPPDINNIVWMVIFKYSNDESVLKRAAEFMEVDLKRSPTNYFSKDTYANVLYKSGQTEKALEIEYQALSQAELAKDSEQVVEYKKTIEKMRKGIPTWNE